MMVMMTLGDAIHQWATRMSLGGGLSRLLPAAARRQARSVRAWTMRELLRVLWALSRPPQGPLRRGRSRARLHVARLRWSDGRRGFQLIRGLTPWHRNSMARQPRVCPFARAATLALNHLLAPRVSTTMRGVARRRPLPVAL